MYVDVKSIKRHLNMDGFTADDLYLAELEEAAEAAIRHRINRKLSDIADCQGNIPDDLKLCIKFLVATWYANREAIAYGEPRKVPITFDYLLQPYINYRKEPYNE